jgi:hypothetical protein
LQLRQRLGKRLALDVRTQQPGGNARLELECQRWNHALGLERRIAGRLGAERIEPRSEMTVCAIGLDERHRGRDASKQLLVHFRFGRNRALRHRVTWRWGAVGTLLEQPHQAGLQREQLGVVALFEEGTPLLGDGRGVLEILLEQLTREARVQRIDVMRHAFSVGTPLLIQRIVRRHGDRHADEEADRADDDRERR